jgi:hypothetical protein
MRTIVSRATDCRHGTHAPSVPIASSRDSWLLPTLSLLFFCSGACALTYQCSGCACWASSLASPRTRRAQSGQFHDRARSRQPDRRSFAERGTSRTSTTVCSRDRTSMSESTTVATICCSRGASTTRHRRYHSSDLCRVGHPVLGRVLSAAPTGLEAGRHRCAMGDRHRGGVQTHRPNLPECLSSHDGLDRWRATGAQDIGTLSFLVPEE